MVNTSDFWGDEHMVALVVELLHIKLIEKLCSCPQIGSGVSINRAK